MSNSKLQNDIEESLQFIHGLVSSAVVCAVEDQSTENVQKSASFLAECAQVTVLLTFLKELSTKDVVCEEGAQNVG